MSKPNGILAMNPEKYREIDGVVFDLDSYARHCKPPEQEKKCEDTPKADENPAEAPSAAPAPVFAVDPYPDGWYPAEDGRPPVPVMGGALPPCESESDVIREENGVKPSFRRCISPQARVPAPAPTRPRIPRASARPVRVRAAPMCSARAFTRSAATDWS